jgi:CheY-like chemotaxis protein
LNKIQGKYIAVYNNSSITTSLENRVSVIRKIEPFNLEIKLWHCRKKYSLTAMPGYDRIYLAHRAKRGKISDNVTPIFFVLIGLDRYDCIEFGRRETGFEPDIKGTKTVMGTFDRFEQYLNDGLSHLYDPTYQPPELLWAIIGSRAHQQQGGKSVQEAVIKAIEQLKPAADVPQNARSKRFYDLLVYRYVKGLTQDKTAELLHLTTRHLRREQQQAIHVLAQHLWEQSRIELPLEKNDGPRDESQDSGAESTATDQASWNSQVKQELQNLQQSTPAIADVEAVIPGVLKVGNVLALKHNVSLKTDVSQSGLTAAIHPSALRQILVTAIEKLVQHMSSGEVIIYAEPHQDGELIRVTVEGCPATADELPHSDLIQEILESQGGSVEIKGVDNSIIFLIDLLSAGKNITVLIVDDNPDLVNFYRHYTARTRYEIVYLDQAQHLFETIAQVNPQIIVLDVMLPDTDGWELLTNLHEHHATRSIPVIICSVVKRQELAAALGAAYYLPKPVRRQQFIEALDQVLSQAASSAPKAETNNPAVC